MARAAINWELLRRGAARQAASRWELQLMAVGLLGCLSICGWTAARPFELARAYVCLQQCGVWLAAWYTLFTALCLVLHWLRPKAGREDEDSAHLPLSAAHFYLKRCLELAQTPLLVLALSLPLWLIVLAYFQLPYGQQFVATDYGWSGAELSTLWPLRLALATAAMLGAVLVPLGAGIALTELGNPARYSYLRGLLRSALLLLAICGAYLLVQAIEYDYFRMAYRQTRGYDWQGFALPLLLLLAGTFAAGLLPRRARIAGLVCSVALVAALLAGTQLPGPEAAELRRVLRYAQLADARYAGGWALGHLSPTKNLRLLMDRLSSNVVLGRPGVVEPTYPEYSEEHRKAWEKLYGKYLLEYEEYEASYAHLPRLPLWFGAAVYPSLLSLLAFGGLLAGNLRRRAPLREED